MSRLAWRPGGAMGTAAATGLATLTARALYRTLRRRPPGGAAVWSRTNHRGDEVTLVEGPAVAVSAALASALTSGLPVRIRAALVAAGAGGAAFGAYDDLAGSGDRRGFRGHLGALARGEVTTGAVKIGGIGAAGLGAAALVGGPAVDVAINTGLIAGGANLLNLFDLRPGRAIKAAVAAGTLTALAAPGESGNRPRPVTAVAAPMGAALALLPEDLAERAMLGDAGANALGAMIGVASAATLSRPARIGVLAGIVALTAASEVVSFTAVIERTPVLRWADMLGRRPVPPPGAGRSGDAPFGDAPSGAAPSGGTPEAPDADPSTAAAVP